MKLKKTVWSHFVLIILLLNITGCHHYYRIGKTKDISAAYIVEKEELDDYLIVHVYDEMWNLQNARNENGQILGTKETITPIHSEFTKNQHKSKKTIRYKKRESSPINEVHIYVSNVKIFDGSEVIIRVDDISKVEVYDKAVSANLERKVFIPIGALLAYALAVANSY